MCGIAPQNWTLDDGSPAADFARGHCKVELESTDEGKQDCFGPGFPVKNDGLSTVGRRDLLHEREPISDTRSRSTNEG